jgi:UDP-N-acetylglucosamine transferase subunit ALG13
VILFTVGTHDAPFDRLVAAAERVAAKTEEQVVVQRGTSRVPSPHCTVYETLPPSRIETLVGEARVVVTHGGPGSILMALAAGHTPFVVPRKARHGEHVDDHQVRFVQRIAGRIHPVEDPEQLPEALESHSSGGPHRDDSKMHEDASREFANRLDDLLHEVIALRSRSRGAIRRAAGFLFRGRGG